LLGPAGILAAYGGSGGGPAPGSIRVTTDLTALATWTPISGVDCDYVVAGDKEIKVQAALAIQPGTKVCFEANSGLEVMETGSFNAKGVATNRIVFTGTVAAKGHWKGLAFRSNNPANELNFVDVRFAGSNDNFCCDYFEGPNVSAAVLVGSNAAATATSSSPIARSPPAATPTVITTPATSPSACPKRVVGCKTPSKPSRGGFSLPLACSGCHG
jgi:hypothetical protein